MMKEDFFCNLALRNLAKLHVLLKVLKAEVGKLH